MTQIELIEKIVSGVITGLQDKKMKQELDPYRKVELMLYNYNLFKKRIEINEQTILRMGQPSGVKGQSFDNDVTSKQAVVNELESKNDQMRSIVQMVDYALDDIKNDTNYPIIQYKYFEEKTDEAIAEIMHKDRSVITKAKKKLIDELVSIIFIEELVAKMV